MRAKIWGCRGSLASPGPDTVKYGGNTSCVELILDNGILIVLDAGTGIRPLGLQYENNPPDQVHLLLTHLHMDHLEGLGFFDPLWRKEVDLHIWGPPTSARSLQSRIAKYLSPPLFPVHISDVPSAPIFHDVPKEPFDIAGLKITAGPVKHPDPTVGYRIENGNKVFCYIPDHEPARGGVNLADAEPRWISGLQLARGADYLLHDSQYTKEEYEARIGWGHSWFADTVTFARRAGAEQLVMFHHDPLHTDDELEEIQAQAIELWDDDGHQPRLAHEGMEIDLG